MRQITLTSLALALGVVLALAPLVLAQQPPPAWKQGQSPELADSPLAPVPLPPTPTPAKDIPVDKIKLPPGFTISVWADGLHNARQMAWGTRGTLFVGTRVAGSVYAVVDRGDRREVKVIAKGLAQPSGVAFKDGALYVAEIPRHWAGRGPWRDRKSTRLNSSHSQISYAVFCFKKKKEQLSSAVEFVPTS